MITSRSNPLVKQYRKIASKLPDSSRRVVVEGIRLVLEAAKSGASFEAFFFTPAALARDEIKGLFEKTKGRAWTAEQVSEEVMESLSLEDTPPGLWALVKPRENLEVISHKRVAVLVGVRDPGNAGTLIRSAEGVGAGVWFSENSVHLFHPKVVKASMGSVFRVPADQGPVIPFLEKLEQQRWTVVAAAPSGGIPYSKWGWKLPFALLLGGEARGLPKEIERLTKVRVSIPLQGEVNSLNVGVAGSVLLLESCRPERTGSKQT